MTTSDRSAPPAAGPATVERSAWLALGVATLVFVLVVIDISAVNVAFPSIAEDLDADVSELSWIISGYNVTLAALLMVAGRLADSWGRKRLFLPGIAIFVTGSVLCGLAPNVAALVAARIVQAVGGAIISPTALAVVLPDFPPQRRSTAIGILGATGGLGAVFGPALGSIVIDVWSWRGIFWINVPVGLAILALGPRLLRESKNPTATGRIDGVGVVVGTAAIALVMFAIVESERLGVLDPRVIGLFVAGLALVPVLLRRSAVHPEPLIDLSLFGHRSFASANAALALYSLAFTSGFLLNSLLLQELWDRSITVTGQALVLAPLLSTIVSPLSGRMADRIGHRWILAAGSLCSATAYLLYLVMVDDRAQVWAVFVPISLLSGFGTGATIATWSSAALSDVAPDRFGTANATIRTTQQVFYALGIAVVVTLQAAGGGPETVAGYRWGWAWVAAAYLGAAILIAVAFPAGSSEDRRVGADVVNRRPQRESR